MRIECQWGRAGAAVKADVAVIVDVLSFSTAVTAATERGAAVFPWWGEGVDELAELVGGVAAAKGRTRERPSLSPVSLAGLGEGAKLVLPSVNGARCTLAAQAEHVFCGCLRNAKAVAAMAAEAGDHVLVVPAGETWSDKNGPDGSMRVAFEDMAGAGAVISHLTGDKSPEAEAMQAVFEAARGDLEARMLASISGQELVERGFADDVRFAAEVDVSEAAPMLMMHRQRYRAAAPASEMAAHRIRYFEDVAKG
ncbi:MAG TPA: 2-phosphosulfolactate phosphatase [Hyphomonadaceae bacterium]|nr:2-phosphosulfolactate phosphatase [Hyphomonadaceae bacterium]